MRHCTHLCPPFAQDTVVAVRRGGDELVVCNVDANKYPEQRFGVDPAQVGGWRSDLVIADVHVSCGRCVCVHVCM